MTSKKERGEAAGGPENPVATNGHNGNGAAAPPVSENEVAYAAFRRNYLIAFLSASSADWLKGPYIYRLYEARGFSPADITFLFCAGYVSSAIFGAVAGLMCDAFGRRLMCLAFCALYITHAFMHALDGFAALLAARVISGVATALLSCAFEAWFVAEHRRRYPQKDLKAVFSMLTQLNSMVAVIAGLASQAAVAVGGYGAPFVLSVTMLTICACIVAGWTENTGAGETSERGSIGSVVRAAMGSMNSLVFRVGCLQFLFEGSMHIFIFLWTPCLHRSETSFEVPHGLVFACYMVSMMFGGWVTSKTVIPLGFVFGLGAAGLATPMLSPDPWLNFAAFCVFECCCGCYFPQIAMLRSRHLAENSRAATITLFRMPLNGIVVGTLLWGRELPSEKVLLAASAALSIGAVIAFTLPKSSVEEAIKKSK